LEKTGKRNERNKVSMKLSNDNALTNGLVMHTVLTEQSAAISCFSGQPQLQRNEMLLFAGFAADFASIA